MLVELPYGKEFLKVQVPSHSILLTGKQGKVLSNPRKSLGEALRQPLGGKPLPRIIADKSAKTACIVVSDHTRPTPNKVILPPLLKEIETSGIDPQSTKLLIANGMHRKTTSLEKGELLGEELLKRYEVIDHDCRNQRELVELDSGKSLGAPVLVNKNYLEADLKIVTGFIEPHFMAGFSGGRKAICPGIAGLETIRYFHGPSLLESPSASPGVLKDNPCHLFALKAAAMSGADFMVNVTLNREKKITGLFCGDLYKAYSEGTGYCESQSSICIDEPVDIVVTTNGGYPLDRDFYQTVKGLVGAAAILRKGGTVICASECSDGIGSDEFRKLLFEMKDPDSFMKMISRPDYFCVDQWEVEELLKVLRKARIALHTAGLSDEEVIKCHAQPIDSIEHGIEKALGEYGPRASIAIIPEGPYLLTKLKERKIG